MSSAPPEGPNTPPDSQDGERPSQLDRAARDSSAEDQAAVERWMALVRRELAAIDVRVLGAARLPVESVNTIHALLPDGRYVVATFEQAPEDREALERRLGILVGTFSQALEGAGRDARGSRPPTPLSLREELRALSLRARAIDALVIDAHSPVVWSSVSGLHLTGDEEDEGVRMVAVGPDLALVEVAPALHESEAEEPVSAKVTPTPAPVLTLARKNPERSERGRAILREVSPVASSTGAQPPGEEGTLESTERLSSESTDPDDGRRNSDFAPPRLYLASEFPAHELALRAIDDVRRLPGINTLRKGKPLSHCAIVDEELGVLAHSFAGIYLLVLVFEGVFDELRAERAAAEALPRIERLVLALPPQDPPPAPMANVVRLGRRRK